ncbi:MAG: carbon storage regulator [Tepidisphaeraceae bacterium]|jgi:carbon storage regulator
MLVLSRRSNESIVIGAPGGVDRLAKLTVIGVRGGTVKLAIEVDGDVAVHRLEVWERIREGRELRRLARGQMTNAAS